MYATEFLELMHSRAKSYRLDAVKSINRNSHMNSLGGKCELDQDQIDAVLTDFINFNGMKMGCDYGLFACDLAKPAHQPEPKP